MVFWDLCIEQQSVDQLPTRQSHKSAEKKGFCENNSLLKKKNQMFHIISSLF